MDQHNTFKMIRQLQADLGLTQEQFAAKIGVTVSTVNRWKKIKVNLLHWQCAGLRESNKK